MSVDARPGEGTGVFSKGRAKISERTLRVDNWRRAPLTTAGILTFFGVYTLIRLFMNKWYYVEDYSYLTPVYSPCISTACVDEASHFGQFLDLPGMIPMAILVFPILAGFRTTCYYYRKAGYRSLWFAPQACAVPEPHKTYSGERRFPLIIMNAHRYFFWLASALLLINIYDAALSWRGADGNFGIGLGTLIITTNVIMLSLYTLSCHACRHAVGGRINNFSKHPMRYKMWTFISKLNPYHGNYAMISLFTVILTDMYIMSLSAGWITDLRIFN